MNARFKIIVPSFNSVAYLPKTLASLEAQTCQEFDALVIDDGSTVPKQREIILDCCKRNSWESRLYDENRGALYRLVHAIREWNCQDEDVLLILDGDDWLAHERALETLQRFYCEEDLYFTWGQCTPYSRDNVSFPCAQPLPEIAVQNKLYRTIPFVFWHPVTFKYYLWRHLKDEELRDENGSYFAIMKDQATHLAMLEMAGKKIRFIDEVLYVYNLDNPLNDFATTTEEEHQRVKERIRSFPKHETLPLCR